MRTILFLGLLAMGCGAEEAPYYTCDDGRVLSEPCPTDGGTGGTTANVTYPGGRSSTGGSVASTGGAPELTCGANQAYCSTTQSNGQCVTCSLPYNGISEGMVPGCAMPNGGPAACVWVCDDGYRPSLYCANNEACCTYNGTSGCGCLRN